MRCPMCDFVNIEGADACEQCDFPLGDLSLPAPEGEIEKALLSDRVGLLTPGSINDGRWNALAWEGVQRIQKELGAEISHQETRTPAEMTEGFRAFGRQGFDLAFGHGFEYQEPARTS